LTYRNNNNNDNSNSNNSHDNVNGAVIMTKVSTRVHPVHLMNVICVIRNFGYFQNNDTSLSGQFCHGKSMVWSTKLVDDRVCGSHVRRSSASWLGAQSNYYTSVDCQPSNSTASICSGLVVQVVLTLFCSS